MPIRQSTQLDPWWRYAWNPLEALDEPWKAERAAKAGVLVAAFFVFASSTRLFLDLASGATTFEILDILAFGLASLACWLVWTKQPRWVAILLLIWTIFELWLMTPVKATLSSTPWTVIVPMAILSLRALRGAYAMHSARSAKPIDSTTAIG